MSEEGQFNMPIVPDDPNREVVTTQGYLKTLHDRIEQLATQVREYSKEVSDQKDVIDTMSTAIGADGHTIYDLRTQLKKLGVDSAATINGQRTKIARFMGELDRIKALVGQALNLLDTEGKTFSELGSLLRAALDTAKIVSREKATEETTELARPLIVRFQSKAGGKGFIVCRTWSEVQKAILLFLQLEEPITVELFTEGELDE